MTGLPAGIWRIGREGRNILALLLVAGGFWMLTHPYLGLAEHDARIYAVLVAHRLDPAAYSHDPFFMYGSQDAFSLFSPLFAALTSALGLADASKFWVGLGGGLWVVAAVALASRMLDGVQARALAVLAAAALSLNYSPNASTFVIAEHFATARIVAFPLGVLAMAAVMAGRWRLATLPGLLAIAIHPLVGIWVLAWAMAVRCTDRQVLALMAIGFGALALGLFLGVPFLEPMDGDWQATLQASTEDVLVGAPGTVRLNATLFWIALLLWAGRLGGPEESRWYRMAAMVGAWGFLSAQIFSYFLPLQLLVQSQLWRSMWVAVCIGVVAAVDILWTAWRRPAGVSCWVVLAALALCGLGSYAGYLLLLAWFLSGGGWWARLQNRLATFERKHGRLLWLALVGGVVVLLPSYFQDLSILGRWVWPEGPLPGQIAVGCLLGGGGGLGLLAVSAIWPNEANWRLIWFAAIPFFAVVSSQWDHRTETYRAWEGGLLQPGAAGELGRYVKPGEVVLWTAQNPLATWFELGTASYASALQATGVVFSREKTFELERRLERIQLSSSLDSLPVSTETGEKERLTGGQQADSRPRQHQNLQRLVTSERVTAVGISYLCEDSALDWVILPSRPAGDYLAPKVANSILGNRQFLYWCADVRGVSPTQRRWARS